ncbi:MAG: hypothetical protein BroJett011_70740 [Chloroflexota bacterium]|nr:MAG: hypothetical protein BroJett011_70740 [Chloroflexota bacterium]
MDDWHDEFSPALFIGREAELAQLIQWVTTNAILSRRLITIAAPPGYGKSWLLGKLQKRLLERHGRDLFIMFVAAADLTSISKMTNWIQSVIKAAREGGLAVRESNPEDSLATIIHHLLEDLCEHSNPPLRPVLMVDGLDELAPKTAEVLQKVFLESFWDKPQLRMIISFRDEFSLTSHTLRLGEERMSLTAFTPPTGKEQLRKRVTSEAPSILFQKDLKDLVALIPQYTWTNPGLNTCLYTKAKKRRVNGQTPLLTVADLNECWLGPIKAKSKELSVTLSELESNLKIVSAEDTWTVETFSQICGYSLVVAHKHIQELIALSLVTNEKQKYKIVDGIRELIRAEVALSNQTK